MTGDDWGEDWDMGDPGPVDTPPPTTIAELALADEDEEPSLIGYCGPDEHVRLSLMIPRVKALVRILEARREEIEAELLKPEYFSSALRERWRQRCREN
jgi:hypothetical protein